MEYYSDIEKFISIMDLIGHYYILNETRTVVDKKGSNYEDGSSDTLIHLHTLNFIDSNSQERVLVEYINEYSDTYHLCSELISVDDYKKDSYNYIRNIN